MASRHPQRFMRSFTSLPTAFAYRPRTIQTIRFYSATSEETTVKTAPYIQMLKADLKTAMRAKDAPRLAVLRAIMAANLNASKTKQPIQTNVQLVTLIGKMKRSAEEAAAEATKANREDLAEKELEQAKIMEEYIKGSMVETLNLDDLRPLIEKEIDAVNAQAEKVKNIMSEVIKRVQAATEGKIVDNKLLAPLVKDLIKERS